MKLRAILLYLLICVSHSVLSQNISVSSFRLLETDMDANLNGTREIDQNGETAALIKIVTTEKGFGFSCGAIGIVKTKETPGEIWLYVPRGAQKITIKHPQLGVLRDWHFTTTIQGGRTYEMVLSTGKVTTIVKQARTSQYVVFQLSPSNAVVELNNEMLETYDGVATKLLKFGTYDYQVKAPNYLTTSGKVKVNNPDSTIQVNVSLNPNFSAVTIEADDNSEIWINGNLRGKGTWNGDLGAGIYEIEARKEGHRPTITTKEIVVSQTPISIVLDSPVPIYGSANLNSTPAKADIIIDGVRIGETPISAYNILTGKHRINIAKQGYEVYQQDIIIEEDKPYELDIKLEKLPDSEYIRSKIKESLSKISTAKSKLTTKDGGTYYGETKGSKPNGVGKATYKNGNYYEGEYVDGKRQGIGIYHFFDGEEYEGEWFQDQQHGKGIYFFQNNNRYEGRWYRDYQHGKGTMYYFNGDKYDGDWKQDKRSGYGVYTFANGASYKGGWLNDKKDGEGVFDWGDGSVYEGEWKENMRSGKGTFKYASGDIYIGQWSDDQMNGRGIYKFQNGDVYEGDYVKGERTGSGVLRYANGDKYTGKFYKGDRKGKGIYVWNNGNIYDGDWNSDQPNGRGKLTDSNGKSYEGLFKNGKYVNNE